jgi:hypothetical protein
MAAITPWPSIKTTFQLVWHRHWWTRFPTTFQILAGWLKKQFIGGTTDSWTNGGLFYG